MRQLNGYSENYFASMPKIAYGLMKEIQRMNKLKALELKFQIDKNYRPSQAEVDAIMNTNPAGQYGQRRDEFED